MRSPHACWNTHACDEPSIISLHCAPVVALPACASLGPVCVLGVLLNNVGFAGGVGRGQAGRPGDAEDAVPQITLSA